MNTATEFYRSQIGGTSVINYSYTDFPLRLLVKDIYYFFVYSWALPWIVMPATSYGSGPLDELYPSWRNMFCVAVHAVLFILQLAFIVGIAVAVFFPVWMGSLFVASFLLLNWLLCKLLNGKDMTFHSLAEYAEARPEHDHEQWIFLNGVAVGQHWMMNNLNRLALTFGRPILGVHNRTSGIIFDVVECLIQRNFSYATSDVRICYKTIKEVLYDPRKSKVVFILHSQGGIEGGLVLDWLLQEMPQDLLSKLEVYTFGNAANHFNNPHRHVISQDLTAWSPIEAVTTYMTERSFGASAHSPVQPAVCKLPALVTAETSTLSTTRTLSAAQDRAIGYIEHYAHTTDFVAIWGVLHFATNKMDSVQLPRFLGRLFSRSTGEGGHQMNQHYLDGMFPLKRDLKTGEYVGADDESEFMEEVIKFGQEGTAMDNAREAFDITYAGTQGFGSGDITTPVEVHGLSRRRSRRTEVKVKELSRLWSYRNGRTPPEAPPLLHAEGGIVRNATM